MVDLLRPVLDQIAKLWARLALMPVIRWGTVTQASPLRVVLDGDAAPMPLTPLTLVRGVDTGMRVLCVEQHRRVIIIDATDTGWVDLSGYLLSGFSGFVEARRSGNVVEIQGNIDGSIPSTNGSTTFTSAIPQAWRPARNQWGPTYRDGYTGSTFLRPAGTLGMANRSGATWPGGQFTITYLLG